MTIDIIIPVLNEETLLTQRADYYRWLGAQSCLTFVDGGSADRTRDLAVRYGQVIETSPGRAVQMNAGARRTKGQFILFLHVDTFVTVEVLAEIHKRLEQGVVVGCCTLAIDDRGLLFRVFETLVNFRARCFRIIDGDLGLFIRRDTFTALGGFAEVPVMEDIYFSKKIRRLKGFAMLPERISVSSRVWHEHGFWRVFGVYTQRYLQFWGEGLRSHSRS